MKLLFIFSFFYTILSVEVGKGMCYKSNRSSTRQLGDNGCLEAHNRARRAKGLPNLEWDNNLASQAQSWSNSLAGSRALRHSGGGENLYSGGGGCSAAVDAWMDEEKDYRGQAIGGGDLMKIGHYTQVMWRNSRKLGCGTAGNYVTCRYSPPGNMIGQRPY